MSSLYLGPPGVGKTLSLVRYVILPAIERGQRVVTNIPLIELAFAFRLKCDVSGLIVLVSADQIRAPNFLFSAQNVGPTTTAGGDVIVIDEAHEFYGSDKKIKSDDEIFRAIRLQRKYTGGAGNWSTQLIFASQSYNDFSRQIREVCDSMYFMQKLTVIGKPDSYRVDIYADARSSPTRGKPINQLYGTYDSEYFDLYNSYSTGVGGFSSASPGVEAVTDQRLNIWNRRIGFGRFSVNMKQARNILVVLVVLFFLWAAYVVYSTIAKSKPAPAVSASTASTSITASPAVTPGTPTAPVPAQAPVDEIRKDESSEYRLIGFYSFNNTAIAVVADRSGVYRYISSGFQTVTAGPASHIKYKGKVIAAWTGEPVAPPTKNAFTEITK
jgi:zona occludens toxin